MQKLKSIDAGDGANMTPLEMARDIVRNRDDSRCALNSHYSQILAREIIRLSAPDPHAEKLADALKDLMAWGVEFDDARLGYLSVQVDRAALESALAVPREYEEAKKK